MSNQLDPQMLENVKSLLKSKDLSDCKVAANILFAGSGEFDPDVHMEFIEHVLFEDEFEEAGFQEFLNEWAVLILESKGIKVQTEE